MDKEQVMDKNILQYIKDAIKNNDFDKITKFLRYSLEMLQETEKAIDAQMNSLKSKMMQTDDNSAILSNGDKFVMDGSIDHLSEIVDFYNEWGMFRIGINMMLSASSFHDQYCVMSEVIRSNGTFIDDDDDIGDEDKSNTIQ